MSGASVRLTLICALASVWAGKFCPVWAAAPAQTDKQRPALQAEVAETDREATQKTENFEKLYAAYQQARANYFQHKQEYDQHLAQFHRQPPQMISGASVNTAGNQNSNSGSNQLPPLPQFKPVKVPPGSAYQSLQNEERMLSELEQQLLALINELISARSKMSSQAYSQQWERAEEKANVLQSRVLAFGQQVFEKEQMSQEELHNLSHAALRDGDAVESRRIFFETQRQSQIDNEEVARAHLHTNIFANLSSQLGRLNPALAAISMVSAPAAPAAPAFISFEQIHGESKRLQSEYENLQARYAELQQAAPPKERAKLDGK